MPVQKTHHCTINTSHSQHTTPEPHSSFILHSSHTDTQSLKQHCPDGFLLGYWSIPRSRCESHRRTVHLAHLRSLTMHFQLEFIRQLSNDPSNTVVGLVRNKTSTLESLDPELKQRTNLHILQADITDYDALKVGA